MRASAEVFFGASVNVADRPLEVNCAPLTPATLDFCQPVGYSTENSGAALVYQEKPGSGVGVAGGADLTGGRVATSELP